MYFTDRGIEELEDRRGDDEVTMAWLAGRLRDFVDLNPDFEVAVDRLASWLARLDGEEDLLPERAVVRASGLALGPRRRVVPDWTARGSRHLSGVCARDMS